MLKFTYVAAIAFFGTMATMDLPLFGEEAVAYEAYFEDDPYVSPAGSLVSEIFEENVGNEGGQCVIFNILVDDDGQTPSYLEDGVEVKKLRWFWQDGAVSYLTVDEARREAASLCKFLESNLFASK